MTAGVGLRMRRTLLFLFFALVAGISFASNCTQWLVSEVNSGGSSGWQSSLAAACTAAAEAGSAGPYTVTVVSVGVEGPSRCVWKIRTDDCAGTDAQCAGFSGRDADTRTGDYCNNPCVAGQHSTINVTSGWARTSTPDANDVVVDLWSSASAITAPRCDGQCSVAFGALKASYRSQVPAANGLHRLSSDIDVISTGEQCSAKSPDVDPTQPPAACPGYVGEVNGKKVCVGAGNTPLPKSPKPSGTPPDTVGNPAAGQVPTSGPGSGVGGPGRTPVSGDGGNAGGGSNAAVPGGGSDGNGQVASGGGSGASGPVEVDVETCGLPGKAPCRIDETGTPNGTGAFDGAKGKLEQSRTSAIDQINAAGSAQGKATGWTWSFSLPTGCTELPMGEFGELGVTSKLCDYQPMIHDLMSLLWIGVTIWACVGMVGRAVGGGS